MTRAEFFNSIKDESYSTGYRSFSGESVPTLPWVLWYETNNIIEAADNMNQVDGSRVIIELYSNHKNPALNQKLEAKLEALGIVYSREETYNNDERVYITIYEMEVLFNG